jgi:hypothetical protein
MSELEAAEKAYERGDISATRRLARAVVAGDGSPTEKARATELLGSLRPDRAALGLLLACVVLLLLVLVRYAG